MVWVWDWPPCLVDVAARGGRLPFVETWPLLVGVGVALLMICSLSSAISIRKLAKLRTGGGVPWISTVNQNIESLEQELSHWLVRARGVTKSFGEGRHENSRAQRRGLRRGQRRSFVTRRSIREWENDLVVGDCRNFRK